jgi:hypothetical protein
MPTITLESTQATQNNREILTRLEQERSLTEKFCYGSGVVMLTGMAIANPLVTVGSLTTFGISLRKLQKLSQLLMAGTAIVDAFEHEGVEIFPQIEVPNCQPVDLFIRFFPSKEFLLISIRSLSGATVVYNEAIETLQVRRKNKGLKKWEADPLSELSDQELWLRKNRRDLFGGSSNDARRPLAKLLILTGETKFRDHSDSLYREINDEKFFTVKKKGTISIIADDQIVPFIRAYLAQRQQAGKA